MSDEIKPALTPQEWATFRMWRADKMPGGYVPVYKTVEQWSPEHKHAGAAECLYEQPFGFTHEDAKDCRDAAEEITSLAVDAFPGYRTPAVVALCERLERLAARIAALLPPE